MSKASQQAAFSKVYLSLFKQGVASTSMMAMPSGVGVERCRYRGDNGNKCAAGHLIPDELYNPDLEGYGVHAVSVDSILANVFPDIDYDLRSLIAGMQSAHDQELKKRGLIEWKIRMHELATSFNLEIPNAED